jgi:DNA-binding phage protein
MGKSHEGKTAQRARDDPTVAHRERLVEELRADPKLAADYLNAAAEKSDAHVYLAALRTVAGR